MIYFKPFSFLVVLTSCILRLTHRVPDSVHLLLLELGELSAVVDDHEQLPDEQQGEADHHDACHDSDHDGDDVGSGWAL